MKANRRIQRAAATLIAAAAPTMSLSGQTVSNYLPPEMLSRPDRQAIFQLGEFDVHARGSVSALYDDNITLRDESMQDDFIFVVSPGLAVVKSDAEVQSATSLSLSYSPAFVFFAEHNEYDSVDHIARFDAGLNLAKMRVSVNQEVESSAGGLADVGSRVSQDYYRTRVRAFYDFSEKSTFELGGHYRITEYDSDRLIDSAEWLADSAAHYRVSAKVRIGLGVSVGQLDVEESQASSITGGIGSPAHTNAVTAGGVQTFVTPSLRASYRSSEKTDVAFAVGGEFRSYDDEDSSFAPVFSIAGTYRPTDRTRVHLEAHRRQQNSVVLSGQNYLATGASVGLKQRLHDRVAGHLNFGYDHADYESARRGVRSTRNDDYFLLRSGLEVMLFPSWSIGAYHQYQENISTENFDFRNHRVGVQSTWVY